MFPICKGSKLYFIRKWMTCFFKIVNVNFLKIWKFLEDISTNSDTQTISIHKSIAAANRRNTFSVLRGSKFRHVMIFKALIQMFVRVTINPLWPDTWIQSVNFTSRGRNGGPTLINFGFFKFLSFSLSIFVLIFHWMWNDEKSLIFSTDLENWWFLI